MSDQTRRFHPAVERLEGRDVPAVTSSIQGNTLFIQGTNAADTALLFQNGNQLILSQPGLPNQIFSAGQIRNVVFNGLGGADAFLNFTGTRMTAFGGAGNDLLLGGNGSNRLFGQAGNDTLLGNFGDLTVGGNGLNRLDTPLNFALNGGLNRFSNLFPGVGLTGFNSQFQTALTSLALSNFNNPFGTGIPATGLGFFNPNMFTQASLMTTPALGAVNFLPINAYQPNFSLYGPDANAYSSNVYLT